MSDPTVAFQRQPLQTLARGGDAVVEDVIETLTDWVHSNWTAHVATHNSNRIYVLDVGTTPLKVVIIARERRQHLYWLDVCAIDDAKAGELMTYFAPFTDVDHFSAVMELKLKKLRPMIIARMVEGLEPELRLPHHGWAKIYHAHTHQHVYERASRLLLAIDSSTDRWASSKARNHFKNLLDDARERPQVVEREGDDLVILSRRYLQETVDPTSAKGLARHYLAMGLTDDDMPTLTHGSVPPLEELPVIRPA